MRIIDMPTMLYVRHALQKWLFIISDSVLTLTSRILKWVNSGGLPISTIYV